MIDGAIYTVLAALAGILVALVISRRSSVFRGAQARPGPSDALPLPDDRSSAEWWSHAERWNGSSFELIVHLGPPDDDRLLAAIQALWSSDMLSGPTASPQGTLPPLLTTSPRSTGNIRFYGMLRLSSSTPIKCCLIAHCLDAADDLTLYVPRGVLEAHFGPEPAAAAGTREVQSALVLVADQLFKKAPFKLGAIGEEVLTSFAFLDRPDVDGYDFEAQFANYLAVAPTIRGTISSEDLEALGASGGILLSPDLRDRAVLPDFGLTVLSSGLLWFNRPRTPRR